MDAEPSSEIDVAKLFEQFSSKLARVAERHLDRRLSSRIDGEDVVQSAFRTFFRRNLRGEFQIESSSEIWRLLVHITVLKARAKGRFHTNSLRNARNEVSLSDINELIASEPSPDEAAALVDLVGRLLEGLPAWYCDALQKRLEGFDKTEIAGELGLSRNSIHRAFRVLQHRLKREWDTIEFQNNSNSG